MPYKLFSVTNGSSEDLSDFQIDIRIDNTNFSDLYNEIDFSKKMYVTDEDGNPIYHWLEYDHYYYKYLFIWFKIPTFNMGDEYRIRFYYNEDTNPYSSYNNPEQVFDFYDSFELDPASNGKWDTVTGTAGTDYTYGNNDGVLDGYYLSYKLTMRLDSINLNKTTMRVTSQISAGASDTSLSYARLSVKDYDNTDQIAYIDIPTQRLNDVKFYISDGTQNESGSLYTVQNYTRTRMDMWLAGINSRFYGEEFYYETSGSHESGFGLMLSSPYIELIYSNYCSKCSGYVYYVAVSKMTVSATDMDTIKNSITMSEPKKQTNMSLAVTVI